MPNTIVINTLLLLLRYLHRDSESRLQGRRRPRSFRCLSVVIVDSPCLGSRGSIHLVDLNISSEAIQDGIGEAVDVQASCRADCLSFLYSDPSAPPHTLTLPLPSPVAMAGRLEEVEEEGPTPTASQVKCKGQEASIESAQGQTAQVVLWFVVWWHCGIMGKVVKCS